MAKKKALVPTSAAYTLDSIDWMKILKGAGLATGGALVAYLSSQVLPDLEPSGPYGLLIAGMAATALNFLSKWITDNTA